MTTPDKLNFIPVKITQLPHTVRKETETATVNVKAGTITFSKRYVEKNKLDNVILEFFVDVNNSALGWKILKNASFFPNLKDYKKVKLNKASIYLLPISKVLKMFNFSKNTKTFKKLDIKRHSCIFDAQYQGVVHYVLLKYHTKKK